MGPHKGRTSPPRASRSTPSATANGCMAPPRPWPLRRGRRKPGAAPKTGGRAGNRGPRRWRRSAGERTRRRRDPPSRVTAPFWCTGRVPQGGSVAHQTDDALFNGTGGARVSLQWRAPPAYTAAGRVGPPPCRTGPGAARAAVDVAGTRGVTTAGGAPDPPRRSAVGVADARRGGPQALRGPSRCAARHTPAGGGALARACRELPSREAERTHLADSTQIAPRGRAPRRSGRACCLGGGRAPPSGARQPQPSRSRGAGGGVGGGEGRASDRPPVASVPVGAVGTCRAGFFLQPRPSARRWCPRRRHHSHRPWSDTPASTLPHPPHPAVVSCIRRTPSPSPWPGTLWVPRLGRGAPPGRVSAPCGYPSPPG